MDLATFARRYLVRYLPWFLAGIAALLLTNWLSVQIPVQVASAIDALGKPDQMTVVPHKAGLIALMGLGIMAVRTASRLLFFIPGRYVEAEVKQDLFAAFLRQQPSFHRKFSVGDLVSRATSDVNAIRMLVGFASLQIVNTTVAVLMSGWQMARISPMLAGLTLIPVSLAFVLTQWSIRPLYRLIAQQQQQLGALSDHILSSYQGVATVQGFVAGGAFTERFDAKNDAYLKTSLQRSNLRVVVGPLLALAISVNVFLLLWIGGPMAIRHELSVGDLVAFTTLVALLVNPLRGMSFLLSMYKQFEVALQRLGAVMLPEPERPDLPSPKPAPDRPPALEVRHLTFAYPDAPDKIVLHDVGFRVPAGGTLGILGATGSGKTTLLRCLSRLYNPPPGTVFVDGVDVREVDLDAWRMRMAYVPQRAFLFSDTLADNVLLGHPDEGRLDRLLTLTTLDVDVAALPQGTLSPVGESGIMLSGGQRQRVALARGLLRPAVVLMLDDVLSAVDSATERQLLDTLSRPTAVSGSARPTTIIVAHRISAIAQADVVVVLQDGRVVDSGTHAELCSRPGPYRDTWERQREGEDDVPRDSA